MTTETFNGNEIAYILTEAQGINEHNSVRYFANGQEILSSELSMVIYNDDQEDVAEVGISALCNQENILSLTINLDREVNSAEIDLGGVFLRNGDRNFAGDISKSNYEISNGTTIITADVTFDDNREIFGDEFNFELTALDLLDPNTTCSVFVAGEIDFEIKSMSLEVQVDDQQKIIECTVD